MPQRSIGISPLRINCALPASRCMLAFRLSQTSMKKLNLCRGIGVQDSCQLRLTTSPSTLTVIGPASRPVFLSVCRITELLQELVACRCLGA
jgi:hypothetical protein